MSNQELLTYLLNAIALGFLTIAAIDFGTRAVAVYNQVKVATSQKDSESPRDSPKSQWTRSETCVFSYSNKAQIAASKSRDGGISTTRITCLLGKLNMGKRWKNQTFPTLKDLFSSL